MKKKKIIKIGAQLFLCDELQNQIEHEITLNLFVLNLNSSTENSPAAAA